MTTLPRSVPIIEDLVHHYGAAAKCRSVRAIDMPVLALEAEPDLAEARLVAEIEAARLALQPPLMTLPDSACVVYGLS